MGLYIETSDRESWLKQNARRIAPGDAIEPDEFKVCVVNNGGFKAYGVAFDDREEAMMRRPDDRPRVWHAAKREDLKLVCPEWGTYVQ